MSSRIATLAVLISAVLCGCQVPPVPAQGANQAPAGGRDPYDGWLWRKVTTGEQPQNQAQAQTSPQVDPNVRQASSTEPQAPASPIATVGPVGMKEPEEFDIDSLSPSNLYKKAKAAAGYGPNEKIARDAFAEGRRLFTEKKYEEAAKQFATAADRWPDTPLEEDALFLLAESYFFSDQYSKAEDAYEALLKKYEYSRYVDRAVGRQFAIGRYWEQYHQAEPHWSLTPNFFDRKRPMFDTWGYAIKSYEHVRLNDPTGPLADDSLMATGNAYFTTGRFEDAAYEYDILRKEYPKSEHGMRASLLCLEAKQRIYQGPAYDGATLQDAGEVADQTLTRYGPALGEKRNLVIDAKNQVVEQKAERDLLVAQYYDTKQYYGAARFYYQVVVRNFPQTNAAEAARRRIDEIKDLPANPPNRLEWLDRVVNPKKRRGRHDDAPAAVAGANGG